MAEVQREVWKADLSYSKDFFNNLMLVKTAALDRDIEDLKKGLIDQSRKIIL